MLTDPVAPFAAKIARKQLCYGAIVTLDDPAVSELAAECGMDFVWYDGEHAPLTIEKIHHHLLALRGSDCAGFVRVPTNNSDVIKPILDLGPAAVIVPMVNNAEAAAAAVAACRYPLRGIRGCGIRRAWGYGAVDFDTYLKRSETSPWIIIQIEHIDAVKNLDAILKVPGLSSICIGPCDLSGSMGILNQMDDPELNKVIDEIAVKVHKAGLPLGTAAGNLPRWKERGINWFAGSADCGAMAAGFRAAVQEAHK